MNAYLAPWSPQLYFAAAGGGPWSIDAWRKG